MYTRSSNYNCIHKAYLHKHNTKLQAYKKELDYISYELLNFHKLKLVGFNNALTIVIQYYITNLTKLEVKVKDQIECIMNSTAIFALDIITNLEKQFGKVLIDKLLNF